VIGVDLPSEAGRRRVDALNDGRFPFETTDSRLGPALGEAQAAGNLIAVTDPAVYGLASVVLVDIPLDVDWSVHPPQLRWEGFQRGIAQLADHVQPGAVVIVETTVPPGTTARVVAPIFAERFAARGLAADAALLAHSYERVMPGEEYLESLVSYWRCYAGTSAAAADACERFLSAVIDVEAYPLTRLHSTTASEMGKVLENSYRATTIALMEEWGRFAEMIGVDLFEVIRAIRHRPTHSNMRQPGFGVGGYCLTKDPLFGAIAARQLFGDGELGFPLSARAVELNKAMPLVSLDKVQSMLGGSLAGRRILLMGVSYRPGVADTRHSPSATFVRAARERGAEVECHDPLVTEWPELGMEVHTELPEIGGYDAVVFAVGNAAYAQLDLVAWLGEARPAVLDGNDVLAEEQRERLRAHGVPVASIGRGT
jgi:nucleotide sugar dehydrogenase